MKNAILKILMCVCLSANIFMGCSNDKVAKNVEYDGILINNEVYQTLSSEDIEKFNKDNNLEPISVQTVYGFDTVFIFGDLYTHGYYEVYKKDGVVTEGRKLSGEGDWSEIGPIVFSGGTASGDYPFAVLYILDDAFVNSGYYLEIIGVNDSSKISIDKKAFAIETNKLGTIMSYKVFDSKGKIIIDEMR